MKPLVLDSLENGIKKLRLLPDNIESYFEFNESANKSKSVMLFEAFSGDLFLWAEDVIKVLSKTKSVSAKNLIEEYEQIYKEYEEELEMLEEYTEYGKGTIIKLLNGTTYLVSNSLDDIESQLQEIDNQERLGF